MGPRCGPFHGTAVAEAEAVGWKGLQSVSLHGSSHGGSRSRAMAGAAEQPHLSNRRWSVATPADEPCSKSTAAAQPHSADVQ
ncbi:MAG: hypothetical protein J5746_02845, partial [Victivallales bacterium]|nr:hypothetical protein [Victivallales bacterium]